ncbi:proliferating cell nuclear antigen (pcna) [Candidatus Micrarchaeota archaeon]|nr:proliferating cell nuclear antigen (pcna) [Candidatus Micrarchaeota archaeon]
MKIISEEAPSLKSAVDSIVSLVEEGLFEVTNDGLTLRAMDPSQISMISFSMPKSAFKEYSISEEKKIGIDISQFSSVLSRGKKDEEAHLTIEDGRLVVQFIGNKRKRTFKIPLLDLSGGIQKEPKIEYENKAEINSDSFKESLKDAKLVSSHVKLILTPEMFGIEVRGDSGNMKAEFLKGEEVSKIEVQGEGARSTFPLQYLEDIVKASRPQENIKVYLETDKPLKLEYEIKGAKAVYYLAPRIESE